ncbi:MAG: quinol oxidase [Candidatus Binatus sp.]|jgi:cytochrome c oxidase subunit 2|nr:quinol oxidase [Candidatus Binatus sp.]
MNATTYKKKLRTVSILAASALIVVGIAAPRFKTVNFVAKAHADIGPRVIEIKARKFEFSPDEVTLKKGEPVILRLTSEDRKHGFLIKPLKIDTDIVPETPTDVAVTPDATGDYTVICDHYCGTGHGGMKMKLKVVE